MTLLRLLLGSLIFVACCKATVSFTESSLVLLPEDAASPFYSGVAMGVVDMDGDGTDDIVRFRNGMDLQIEYQQSPGAVFSTGAEVFFDSIRVAVATADHDGNGFDTSRNSRGFGLKAMRERAEELGGAISIDSNQSKGSRVTANIPL